MQAHAVALRNPYDPFADREVIAIRRPLRIRTLARRARMDERRPFVCTLNGTPLLRAEWQRTVADGDVVAFVALPLGGKAGSNILAIVATIALAWVASPAAAAIVGATEGVAFQVARAVIMVAGSALISSVLAPSRGTTPQRASESAAASPTYALSAQGNTARLSQPIPVAYGRNRIWPDFAAAPYAEFAGNEAFLYQLHVVGQGDFAIEAVQIEDSIVQASPAVGGVHDATGAFPEIRYEIVPPGGNVTLFPTNVVSSAEVSGQELTNAGYIGPFAASGPSIATNAIAVDVICARGLFYANDAGGLDQKLLQVSFDAQPIDANGTPTGDWFLLGSRQIGPMATATPQRVSYRFELPPGRYQVRGRRLDAKDTRPRAAHEVSWSGLRAYIPGEQQYGNLTLLALRMRATNSLSETSARRINVIATRKLPTWHPSTGWSPTPVATRSIAWAIADACRAGYGGDMADDRYDLGQLYALDQVWSARGDTLDYVFDSRLSLWEALEAMARCGRTTRFLQGGVIRFARDQARTVPVQVFSRRNIVAGSLEREYLMPGPEDAEGIEVEYWDQSTWAPATVRCQAAGPMPTRWAKIRIPGIGNRPQAWREGMYQLADHLYRRMRVTFTTELEGHLGNRGDPAALSWDVPGWGTSCEVEAATGLNGAGGIDAGGVLSLSEAVEFAPGLNHYLAMRRPDGSLAGPYLVLPGPDAKRVIMGQTVVGFAPAGSGERTHALFGPGSQQYIPIRILSTRPRAGRVEVTASNEDPAVHVLDQGVVPPPVGGWLTPGPLDKPTIPGPLIVRLEGTLEQPALVVSWPAAPGARSYLVDLSRDAQVWTRAAGDVTATAIRLTVARGSGWVRVAPMGLLRGDYVSAAYNTESLGTLPPDVTGLVLVSPFQGREVAVKWAPTARTDYYLVHVIGLGTTRRTITVAQGPDPRYTYTDEQARQDGGPWRSVTIRVWAVNGAGQSATAAEIVATNPAPGAPLGISIEAGYGAIFVSTAPPADPDVIGLKVWWGTSPGFTPSDAQVVDSITPTMAMIPNLDTGVTIYLRLAHYDVFGKGAAELTLSSELAGTPGGIETGLFDNDNLILNGGAEEGMVGWLAAAGVLDSTLADRAEGSRSWKLTGTGARAMSRGFPVVGGTYYLVRMRSRGSGSGSGVQARVAFGAKDAQGYVQISGATVLQAFSASVTANWGTLVGLVQAPSGALWGSLHVDRGTQPELYFDAVEVRRQITEVEIADGAIKAPKIDALQINTYHLNGRMVNAENINVSRLSALTANLGTVTAGFLELSHNGTDGGWGAVRAYGKWWRDNNQGFAMGRHGDGSSLFEVQGGQSAIRLSSWGDNEIHFTNAAGAEKFHVDSSGNARFAGALQAATGTFAGALQAATGTFSGTLTASAVNAVQELNIGGEAVTFFMSFEATGWYQNMSGWNCPPYSTPAERILLDLTLWFSGNRQPFFLFETPPVLSAQANASFGALRMGVMLVIDGVGVKDWVAPIASIYETPDARPMSAVIRFPFVPTRGNHRVQLRARVENRGSVGGTLSGFLSVSASGGMLWDVKR